MPIYSGFVLGYTHLLWGLQVHRFNQNKGWRIINTTKLNRNQQLPGTYKRLIELINSCKTHNDTMTTQVTI